MWRRMFLASVFLSTLLAVAATLISVRSNAVSDQMMLPVEPGDTYSYGLVSKNDGVTIVRNPNVLEEPRGFHWVAFEIPPPPGRRYERAGFDVRGDGDRLRIRLPYWVVMLAFSLLPAAYIVRVWARGRRSARRAAKGLCAACGYDLRGVGGPGRCPECGSVGVETAAAAAHPN